MRRFAATFISRPEGLCPVEGAVSVSRTLSNVADYGHAAIRRELS